MIVQGLRDYSAKFANRGKKMSSKKLRYIADRISLKYIYSIYRRWDKKDGSLGTIDPVTAAAIWDLYNDLTPEAKALFGLYP